VLILLCRKKRSYDKGEKLPVYFQRSRIKRRLQRCIDNVNGLLESAILLLGSESGQQYSVGLYIYAVEEFGKAILFKTYAGENKSRYPIPRWILGEGNTSFGSICGDRILKQLLKQVLINKT
jgi:hypothetical protein